MDINFLKFIGKLKKPTEYFLGYPLTLVALFFIVKILYAEKDRIILSLRQTNLYLLILGVVFISLFFLLKGVIWLLLLKEREGKVVNKRLLFFYTLSETKRYVPGSIFAYIARVRTHKFNEIPRNRILKNIVIEVIILVVSAFLVSVSGINFLIKINWNLLTNYLFLSLLLLVAAVFLWTLYFIAGKISETISYAALLKRYVPLVSLGCLAWITFGIGNFLVASAFVNFNPYYFGVISSLFVFAWLTGYLSIIVPMGLGVREWMIIYSLSSFASFYLLSAIALFSRVAMIVSELIFLFFSYIFYKIKYTSFLRKIDIYLFLLSISVISYSLYFSFFSIVRHDNFLSGRFDLGNMAQTIWNTYHGSIFQLTNPDGVMQISRLGIHADFILIFLAPLYAIWEDPRILLIFQSTVIASGAFFVYAIALSILKNLELKSMRRKISLALGISYLLNFYIQKQTVFDFHAVSLSTTFLLATYYFFLKKRYTLFTLFLILSVLCKENIYLISAFFGVTLFLRKKKIIGTLLTLFSLGAFYLLMTKFIPGARGMEHFAISYLGYLGDKPTQIVASFFLKPYLLIPLIFNFGTFRYLYELFVTTGFLSLISPSSLMYIIPDITINILSTNSNLRSYQFHYGATIIPFIYISTAYGIKKILSTDKNYISSQIVLYYLVGVTLFTTWNFGILPATKNADYSPFERAEKNKDFINKALSKIPNDASVSATNNIGAHLSHRKIIYVLPRGIENAQYLVFYNENIKLAKEYEVNKNYEEIAHLSDFWIFKKN